MDKIWGKKKGVFLNVVENDCNQTLNKKKINGVCDDNLKWITVDNESILFNGTEYICMKCRFSTKNLKDFRRHLKTKKHKKKPQKKPLIINKKKFVCLCGKEYRFQSGLSKHKFKCEKNMENEEEKKNEKKIDKNDNSSYGFVQKNEKKDKNNKNNKKKDKNVANTGHNNNENKHVVNQIINAFNHLQLQKVI